MTITTNKVTELLKSLFPDDANRIYNAYIDNFTDKSVGVFFADNRSPNMISLGGLDCTPTRVLPVSIKFRWGTNSLASDIKVTGVYDTLLQLPNNITFGDTKFAYIELEDSSPISIGRDKSNICETVIRANFHYYI